jgi:hypothetical protein
MHSVVDLHKLFSCGGGESCWSADYEEDCVFKHADTTCKAALLNIIGDFLVDAYVQLSTGKAMWDALEARYGVSDVSSELYVME